MIIFRNKGLIDLLAVTTMGVNVKERPNAFGQFGTGLKFGIATVLRGGGEIFLFRGQRVHKITTGPSDIRGETFNIVKLDGKRLGFTDQLGKNWEPWMVLREFGCNALDEGGEFYQVPDDHDILTNDALPNEDEDSVTIFAVRWEPLEEAYTQRAKLFAEGQILYESPRLRIRVGRSENLFYRGIRAYKLEHPSVFTYDILEEQRLTEDRTLGTPYYADAIIRSEIVTKVEDPELLAGLLCVDQDDAYERKIAYDDEPSKAFLDTAMEAKERKDRTLNSHARGILEKHIRSTSDDYVSYGGGGGYARRKDRFSLAMEALEDVGFPTSGRVVIMMDELPEESGVPQESCLEDERIYITREFTRLPVRKIAEVIMDYCLQLDAPYDSAYKTRSIMIPLLLDTHPDLVEKKQVGEDDDPPAPAPVAVPAELDF